MPDTLSDKEIEALIRLLDDSDEEVYTHVKDRIITLGEPVIPQLEEAWEHSFNHILQTRIEDIIHKIQLDSLIGKLSNWREEGSTDLLKGALLVARYQYPDLEEEPYYRQLELIKKDILAESQEKMTPVEQIKVINHVLFDVFRFSGNKASFHAPPNNYINSVLESKKGNPLSLSIVYLVVAQSLNIPLAGVNLPEHFVLGYIGQGRRNALGELEQPISFYINPFSKGTIFSKREIDTFLSQLKISPQPEFYRPCSNRQIILRMINNLIFAYEGMGYKHKADELKQLRQIVS
jgi:regulator of sirC expression with transglutaminase-like and TPR domain